MSPVLRLGRRDRSVRQAAEPPSTADSFHECENVNELLKRFIRSQYPPGTAFYIGDLCSIHRQQWPEFDWMPYGAI